MDNQDGITAINELEKDNFFAQNPTGLGMITNEHGQIVKFWEHPILGEDSPVMVSIEDPGTGEEYLFESTFWDTQDMMDGEDYEPVLKDGVMYSKFELWERPEFLTINPSGL